MNIELQRFRVNKRHPLTISRGTSTGSENLLVTIEHEGIRGMGEMAPATGATTETAQSAQALLERWRPLLGGVSPQAMQQVEHLLQVQDGERAAFGALDMALHDWQGRRLQRPVWKLLGLDACVLPPTSLTVGIAPPDVTRERVRETLARANARILKIKLGDPQGIGADKAAFAAAQDAARTWARETGQPAPVWRVDANGGWGLEDARHMLDWLAQRGVEFVEQPLARGQEAGLDALHQNAPLPVYVDESVRVARDIPPLAAGVDGVVLKLMKCGGLREALRFVHTARACGLKVLIGCMSETSLAITAAAQLGPLADALDLDSHLNLAADPFVGAAFEGGSLTLKDAPGLGVHPTFGMSVLQLASSNA